MAKGRGSRPTSALTDNPRAKLWRLIETYAEAYYAEAVKGGGDPADFAEIDRRLEKSREALEGFITNLRLPL